MSAEPNSTRQTLSSTRDAMTALANTLTWADATAGRGDYAGAVGWLDFLEQIGYPLPADYDTKRQTWLAALASTITNPHDEPPEIPDLMRGAPNSDKPRRSPITLANAALHPASSAPDKARPVPTRPSGNAGPASWQPNAGDDEIRGPTAS
jgi:hypothetical protein